MKRTQNDFRLNVVAFKMFTKVCQNAVCFGEKTGGHVSVNKIQPTNNSHIDIHSDSHRRQLETTVACVRPMEIKELSQYRTPFGIEAILYKSMPKNIVTNGDANSLIVCSIRIEFIFNFLAV